MISSYLEIALQAAIKAGEAIMEVYNGKRFRVDYKEDSSPVTVADRRASSIIVEELSRFGIPVISEEEYIPEYDVRKRWASCWIIDPLDGTKEFIKKSTDFTVNIALVRQKQPALGVIYAPVTKMLYFGGTGMGAFRMKVENGVGDLRKKELMVALPDEDSGLKYRIVCTKSHMNKETQDAIEIIERQRGRDNCEQVSVGSSLKFCLMAEGRADFYPRYSNIMEWDTAAGHAIAEAAGCRVRQLDGSALVYNKRDLYNPYFIVERPE